MSRSLSRIRNLVSEIEEIHRQGQQGGKTALTRTASLKPEVTAPPFQTPSFSQPTVQPAPVAPVVIPVTQAYVPPVTPVQAAPVHTPPPTQEEIEVDPFEELDKVVNLDEHREIFQEEAPHEAKIYMQLSGAVALSLQIADTGEVVELKQVGDLLEIRFADGKAFHIPLKAVA